MRVERIMSRSTAKMTQDRPNRCADCGAPTPDFLCRRCAEICDKLTSRGEYWQRVVGSTNRIETHDSTRPGVQGLNKPESFESGR